ncbi:MAG: hypothetical protein GF408_05330 [Candidatus Omnitrophica bacterium]|nr:hypothetical protein [Candidatus Omnitrophota bacterium]
MKILLNIAVFSMCVLAPAAASASVRVVDCGGRSEVLLPGGSAPVECVTGLELEKGARITTSNGAFVSIAFDRSEGNIVTVREDSEVVMLLEGGDRIKLVSGEVFAMLENLDKGKSFRVKTPCASCGARGTGWNTFTDGKVTEVSVIDGRVFVRGINKNGSPMEKAHWVDKGFERRIELHGRPGKMRKIPEKKLQKIRGFAGKPLSPRRSGDTGPRKAAALREREPVRKAIRDTRKAGPEALLRGRIEKSPVIRKERRLYSRPSRPADLKRSGARDKRDFKRRESIKRMLQRDEGTEETIIEEERIRVIAE